ncbi:MAG: metal-dependent hydrolase [Flavobacteriales bacterium]|nr:metal-dependent hydrolase [Flavobacteriales bacterium]
MKITYFGHSCAGVQVDGLQLLFDPFITGNPKAKAIDVHTLPASHVLLTHGHGDHVGDAPTIATRTHATVIANFEIANWMTDQGAKHTIGLNTGGQVEVDGITVKLTWAQHSSQLPDGTYGGNPGGFVVTTSEGAFHHAGDTALMSDMRWLDRHDLKFAFLPIGDHFTMGVTDAIEAARLMGVRRIVGIHYNTFPPITIDPDAARRAFADAGLELLLPSIGQTIEIP